ncbi:hypothetical protein [Sphingopyxis sp.]|jgi:hypothetical protein|uniref:hypothetical protein n=1 Tax=Sphingopyxis sp. TaxID=1908224 RepID=UPI003F71259E
MERSLLQRINAFLKETAMPPSVFGRAAVRDPMLVSDLRRGREPGGPLICRVEHFMNTWRADRHAGRITSYQNRRGRPLGKAGAGERA